MAMQRAGVNRPFGPRYRDLFGLLLRQFKFTDRIKDSGDRARLFEVMEILPEIETWRNGLTDDERRRWVSPDHGAAGIQKGGTQGERAA